MSSVQTHDNCVPHANKTPQHKDSKSVERWATAYRLSIQSSASEPLTFRRLMHRCGGIFQHARLDLFCQSIRLVYLLPDLSPENLIQCIVFHDSIESTYACLSYEWNRALHLRSDRHTGFDERIILINDRPFLIRENLFDFLCTARYNATRSWRLHTIDLSTPLWIDAVCINQASPTERNHQVKLIGAIYSQALTVHAWLGTAKPPIEESEAPGVYERRAHKFTERFETAMQHWSASVPGDNRMPYDHKHVLAYIARSTYWKRAWVVQEICLARKLILWVHTVPVDKSLIQNIQTDHFWTLTKDDDFNQYRYTGFKKPIQSGLLTTLYQFQNKQCEDPRDRVYSLLSLCSVGTSPIPIDYEIELDQLAYHVLLGHPGRVCLCTAMFIARQLELFPSPNEDKEPPNIRGVDTPWIEVNIVLNTWEILNPCDSLRPVLLAVTENFVTSIWTSDEAGFRLRGTNQEIHTMRIALRALGKVGETYGGGALCKNACLETDNQLATVRLGKGHDGIDVNGLETLGNVHHTFSGAE